MAKLTEPTAPQYLKPHEAAQYLGSSVSTLAKRRIYGGGPKFCRLGKGVRYSDIVPSRAVTSTVADASVQRHNLIEALEFLTSTRPGFRAKLALIVEARRAELGLTWDQLIIPAGAFHVARNEPTS
jgi:hypothetical protein